MDFVLQLPQSQRGDDVYLLLFMMVHYVACNKHGDTSHIARHFFKEVVWLHRLPLSSTSNRNTKFLSHLWQTLWKLLGTRLQFSCTYHLQTKIQTKIADWTLLKLLCCLVQDQPRQWDLMLPWAKLLLTILSIVRL